jgi:hypothetical protein
VDFSAEAERVLTLLDYAILVVSAPDGVQNHTRTLWQLLEHYSVPAFLFVNKTDLAVKRKEEMEDDLRKSLSPACVGFYEKESTAERDERLSMLREDWMEAVLEGETIEDSEIAALVSQRKLFPTLFGAALRLDGVGFLLEALDRYTLSPSYEEEAFGAKVYKINRAGSTRLTYIKVTGGRLSPRDEVSYTAADGKRITEKVAQLRLYSGDKFEQVDRVEAGEIAAVLGLTATYAGQGLGTEADTGRPILEPVLSYAITLPEGVREIPEGAFMACTSLRTIDLRGEIGLIGFGAFSLCEELSVVELPDSVHTVAEKAFSECTALSAVKLSGSLSSIGKSAFEKCPELSYLYYPGSQEDLDRVSLPEGGWSAVGTFIIKCGS